MDGESPDLEAAGSIRLVLARLVSAANLLAGTTTDLTRMSRVSEELEWVRRAAGTIIAPLQPDGVLRGLATTMLEGLEASRVSVWLYDDAEGAFHRRASAANAPRRAISRPGERVVPEPAALHRLAGSHGGFFVEDLQQDATELSAWGPALRASGMRSVYVIPLQLQGRLVGVVHAGFSEVTLPRQDRMDLAQIMANYAAVALNNASLYQTVAQQARTLEALNGIAQSVNLQQEPGAMAREIARWARSGLDADRVAFWAFHEQDRTLELQATSALAAGTEEDSGLGRISLSEPIQDAIASGQPRPIAGDWLPLRGSEQMRLYARRLGVARARDRLAIPVSHQGTVFGVLVAGYAGEPDLGMAILQFARNIGDHAGAALATSRLIEGMRRGGQELVLLSAISRRVTANLDLSTAFQSIGEAATVLFGADGVCFWQLRDGILEPAARTGRAAALVARPIGLHEERAKTKALRERAPVFIRDLPNHDLATPQDRLQFRAMGIRAATVVPLIYLGEPLGVLSLLYLREPEFTPQAAFLMMEYASHAAHAIVNARRFEQVVHLAIRDGLTGLLNQRELYQRLREEMARAQRGRAPLCVVMLDLDDFKEVNDREGHLAGDEVLRQVAGVLQRDVRVSDVVARYGGDEFALVLPGLDRSTAEAIAERTRAAISSHLFLLPSGETCRLTASLGIAEYEDSTSSAEGLVGAADRALYQAKSSGGNCIRVG